MNSSNQLEIISRGSVEILTPWSSSSPEHASQTNGATDVNINQQLSLEPLPPERPRYSDCCCDTTEQVVLPSEEEDVSLYLDTATSELAHSRLQTENLLQRIEELSGRIRSGLNLVENTGATIPRLPLKEDVGDPGDVMMTSSPEETHQGVTGTPSRGEENSRSGTCITVGGGEEGGEGKEGGVRGVVSPQADGDPKLVKALEKMRRLDKKLADVVKREREVKEQRRELEMQITGVECYSPYSCSSEDDVSVSPVFPTQVVEDATQHGDTQQTPKGANSTQRNIEQVSEAGMVVVLSEDERCRLEQLLAQDEDHTEEEDTCSGSRTNYFSFSAADQTALGHIDTQLQALNHSATVCGSVSSYSCELAQHHSSRELESQKLVEIDEKLTQLQNSNPSEPHVLSPSVLHHLLEQCAKEQHIS